MAKSKTNAKKANAKGKSVKPVVKSKSKPVSKKSAKSVKKTTIRTKIVAKIAKKAKPVVSKKTIVKQSKKVAKAKPIAKKKVVVKSKFVQPVKKAKIAKVKKKVSNSKLKPVKANRLSKRVSANSFKERMQKQNALKPEKKQMYHTVVKVQPKQNSKKHIAIKDMNMRYSDEELKEFKELIDKKLVTARDELKYLKEALDNHNDNQAGSKAWNMEEGSDTSEMETLMNQISRQHQYLRNLELALVRVENKTYGICRLTGKLIPKERLRIVPHATLSLEAKMNRKAEDATPNSVAAATPPSDFAEGFED